jgi:hypothetical protein
MRGKYVGDFEGGYEHGDGSLVTRDGVEYSGAFKKGLKSGVGALIVFFSPSYSCFSIELFGLLINQER